MPKPNMYPTAFRIESPQGATSGPNRLRAGLAAAATMASMLGEVRQQTPAEKAEEDTNLGRVTRSELDVDTGVVTHVMPDGSRRVQEPVDPTRLPY